jgi:hypothetical protein
MDEGQGRSGRHGERREDSGLRTSMSTVIVWDIETVPDLMGFAAASGR